MKKKAFCFFCERMFPWWSHEASLTNHVAKVSSRSGQKAVFHLLGDDKLKLLEYIPGRRISNVADEPLEPRSTDGNSTLPQKYSREPGPGVSNVFKKGARGQPGSSLTPLALDAPSTKFFECILAQTIPTSENIVASISSQQLLEASFLCRKESPKEHPDGREQRLVSKSASTLISKSKMGSLHCLLSHTFN